MNLLIVLVGLPRSGKSTWALDHIMPTVSPDAIRSTLRASGTPLVPREMVDHMATFMVRSLFLAGHTRLILDDCNEKRKHRDKWYPKAKDPTWEVRFVHIFTGMDICIGRADDPDHTQVIRQMEDDFEPLEADELIYDAYEKVPEEVLRKVGL